ncbi:hypothetical protein [uncultured Nisaea sp.]|uniref:hypothetical protein n=1 Tax=uncultured Nisaea sp. TaxID=538215 RepID=UPI0030EB8348|tara:strand:+ start:4478 stop:4921 length:444 start_codon:yes stop_codon:yes gene_type:complete
MSRIASDDSLWPLGILMLEGAQSLQQHEQMLSIWDDWFARGERFVPLRVHLDESALDQAPGVARVTKQWLKAGAAENMRRLVSAMVIVVPPSRFEAMRQLSVETVFGVPGGIFATVDDALEWAEAADHLTAETVTAAQNIVNPFHTI